MTRSVLTSLYALGLGMTGLIALILLTNPGALAANAVPLAFFAALSFFVKRAGFHVAPQVTHSLVGIVDLAAIFVFGPVFGAWVAASTGFLYLLLNAWRRERHSFHNLVEIPLFNGGLKIGMTFASSQLYVVFGGQIPPRGLDPAAAPAFLAAMLAWFAVDHIGWGFMELVRGGWNTFVEFVRRIFYFSLLVELLPLPIAIVIALVYTLLDRGVFLLLALAFLGTAIVVQGFADASAHLERRRHELSVLNEFGQALSQVAFEPEKIANLLCEHARRIVPADTCRVELLDSNHAPRSGLGVLEVADGETKQFEKNAPVSPLLEYFSTHHEPIRAQQFDKRLIHPSEAVAPMLAARAQVQINGRQPHSAVVVPMLTGSRLIGALGLYAVHSDAFSATHASNLLSMAAQGAVAIHNARLYAMEQKRATELAMVSDVSRQVALVLDLDELFRQVVHRIRERFGYHKVHIFTLDNAGYLNFRASTDPHSDEWRRSGWRLRLGLDGIIGWAAAIGEPKIVDDVSQEPRFIMDPGETTTETRSEIAVPLIVGNQVVGILDVQASALRAFDQEDLFVLRTLGAQVAIAIQDARLFHAQREEAWYLNVLLQVSQNLAATTDLDDALEKVVRITPLLVGVAHCAVFLHRPADKAFVAAKVYGLDQAKQKAFYGLSFADDGENPLSRVKQENRTVLVEDASPTSSPELKEVFGEGGLLLAPLATRGHVVGALLVDHGHEQRDASGRVYPYTQHEIDIITGIANQAAVAIEGARLQSEAEGKKRYEYELGLARQIQQSFLPDACPVIPGYEICSFWRTAREVGGDFYDFVPLSGGRWATVIADVSDKGMAAALFMALSRTIVRTMAIGKPTPHEALDRANDLILADARSEMFVTVFFGVLEPASGRFVYVNAGHNPPLLYCAASKQVTPVSGHGLALGVLPDIALEDYTLELEPGDLLLLYTDGVTEIFNAQGEEFGAGRLASIVVACGHLPSSDVIEQIEQAVIAFAGDQAAFDDQTMVAIKRVAADHPGTSTAMTVEETRE